MANNTSAPPAGNPPVAVAPGYPTGMMPPPQPGQPAYYPPGQPGAYAPPGQPGAYAPPGQPGAYAPPGQPGAYPPPGHPGAYPPPGHPGAYPPPGQPAPPHNPLYQPVYVQMVQRPTGYQVGTCTCGGDLGAEHWTVLAWVLCVCFCPFNFCYPYCMPTARHCKNCGKTYYKEV